jgi:hypothetical protein
MERAGMGIFLRDVDVDVDVDGDVGGGGRKEELQRAIAGTPHLCDKSINIASVQGSWEGPGEFTTAR